MADKNIYANFLISPRYKILRHLLLFVFIATISYQLVYAEFTGKFRIFTSLIFVVSFLSMIYFNLYVLVPKFLFKNKLILYILFVFVSIISMIIVVIVLQSFSEEKIIVDKTASSVPRHRTIVTINILSNMIALGLVIAGSTVALLFRHGLIYGQQIGELETATMQSELEQLKNQISPHFLFNMLNNANVLTKENPKEASRILFKLNDLLKYQLKGSTQDQVLLDDDIQLLNDLLNLEKIRRDHFEFSVLQEGDTANIAIPPLLFTPFVENAIKHNNDNQKLSYVYVLFQVKDDKLCFSCMNSKPIRQRVQQDAGGLGLANIKRRLGLLYPDKHTLEIIDKTDMFVVNLQILL